MAGKLFINYRRDDSSGTAGRLYDRLAHSFGRQNVFMDVDHIPAGVDFVQHLDTQVAASNVFLVILGPHWLDAKDEAGERRLDNPEDFVAIEIAAALARNIRVIPVLVDGAQMPKAAQLPDVLKSLVRRNAVEVRNSQFGRDADALTAKVREALHIAPGRLRSRSGLAAMAAVVLAIAAGAVLYFAPPLWGSRPASPPTQTTQAPPSASTAAPPPPAASTPVDREKTRLIRTFPGNRNGVTWAAFAPGGTAIITNASYTEPNAVFKVMDVKSGQILKGYGGTKGVRGAPFTPDGKSLVAFGRTPELRWWDATEPLRQWTHLVDGEPEWVTALSFSPDGGTYVLAASDGILRVRETKTGSTLFKVTGQGYLWNAIFSPDGRFILYSGADGVAKLCDARTGKAQSELAGAKGRTVSLAFSPDSRTAYTGSADGAVRIWDVTTGKLLRAFTAHTGDIIAMGLSPGGQFLASGGTDHLVKIWDLQAETEPLTLTGHTGNVWMLTIAPDGRSLVSSGIDESVRLWDISDLAAKDGPARR